MRLHEALFYLLQLLCMLSGITMAAFLLQAEAQNSNTAWMRLLYEYIQIRQVLTNLFAKTKVPKPLGRIIFACGIMKVKRTILCKVGTLLGNEIVNQLIDYTSVSKTNTTVSGSPNHRTNHKSVLYYAAGQRVPDGHARVEFITRHSVSYSKRLSSSCRRGNQRRCRLHVLHTVMCN